MSAKLSPPQGFSLKMGTRTCEISYTSGVVMSPEERTDTRRIYYKERDDGPRKMMEQETERQNFHLLKDSGREICVQTTNEGINVREGQRISLIRCEVEGGKTYNLGFVNHTTDEIEVLAEDWQKTFTPNPVISISIFVASIFLLQVYLGGSIIFAVIGGLFLGFFIEKVTRIYGFMNPAIDKLEKKVMSLMEKIRALDNS